MRVERGKIKNESVPMILSPSNCRMAVALIRISMWILERIQVLFGHMTFEETKEIVMT